MISGSRRSPAAHRRRRTIALTRGVAAHAVAVHVHVVLSVYLCRVGPLSPLLPREHHLVEVHRLHRLLLLQVQCQGGQSQHLIGLLGCLRVGVGHLQLLPTNFKAVQAGYRVGGGEEKLVLHEAVAATLPRDLVVDDFHAFNLAKLAEKLVDLGLVHEGWEIVHDEVAQRVRIRCVAASAEIAAIVVRVVIVAVQTAAAQRGG